MLSVGSLFLERWVLLSSEDLKIFLDDFVDFLDGLEACIVKLKRQIHKLEG
jgi:hypothetical protein